MVQSVRVKLVPMMLGSLTSPKQKVSQRKVNRIKLWR